MTAKRRVRWRIKFYHAFALGVAPARKAQHEFQLRAFGVFARGFIGEGLIKRDPVQLPLDLLVKRADPDVANTLSRHRSRKTVKIKFITLHKLGAGCARTSPTI